MAATLCGRIITKTGCLPLVQSVRHGSKAVTRHRKPMHFLKQKLMAVTEYVPPKRAAPPGALAPRVQKTEEGHCHAGTGLGHLVPGKGNLNVKTYKDSSNLVAKVFGGSLMAVMESGLVRLLKRDLETVFNECKMIAVLQNNATNAEDMLLLKHRLRKHDISIKFFPNQVMRSFLPGSRYKNMQPLFIGQTVMFVSKEPKAKEMLQVLRSSPQMLLLGACIENTLLSREGIVSYSRMPSMRTVHGELVGGLTLMTSHTVSMLRQHPAYLSALLQQYIKQQQPADRAELEAAPKAEETKA